MNAYGNSVLPAYTPIEENAGGEAERWLSNSSQILPDYTGVQEIPEGNLRQNIWDQSQILPRHMSLGVDATTPTAPKLLALTPLKAFIAIAGTLAIGIWVGHSIGTADY